MKVTVLMPVYNAAAYIAEAVNSVLVQTYTDFELLIVNNSSTDDTIAVIKSFADTRIRLIEETQQGIAFALNKGLSEARGEYIARFDADDICEPARLEKQLDFLEKNPDYIVCGSDAEYMSEDGEHLFNFRCVGHEHEEIMKQLQVDCPIIHSAVIYRKQPILLAGGYPADAHNFEDYLLWVQIAKRGKFYNIPERLIKVRFNHASVTIDEKWRGTRFRQLKKKIIMQGFVTYDEGQELLSIIRHQDNPKIKEGAYYALCGKKFLLDNHRPAKARVHLRNAIRIHPSRLDNYMFYMLTFFPKSFVQWLHSKSS